jgi:signal transduction histidine kinase
VTLATLTIADLRRFDLFDDLSDDELEEWIPVAAERDAEAGQVLVHEDTTVEGLILLLSGTVEISKRDGDRNDPIARSPAPTWLGAIPALMGGPMKVRMRAETPCRYALVERAEFRRLAFAQPAVHDRVLTEIGPVLNRIASIEHDRERLASLGTMAAGLAHELNNPAAAARRTAAELAEALDVIGGVLAKFVGAKIERADAEELIALQQEALARATAASALDALDAADAEDDLLARLEDLGVAEPWRIAEPLAAAGLDQAWLDRVARLAGGGTGSALRWIAATLNAGKLAAELQESTERMSSLVGAIKAYAYMDRGGVVEVDVHEGLETTLTVMGHKLKHTDIAVVRDYDRTLPRLTVRGSELNQVWTNLLDNAIDAVGDRGTISITSRRDGNCAEIEIADDGPGVPVEARDRIFDPFFTTKDVGQGTGLGLATAHRIVVDRHTGSLTFESEPGRTVFRVRLPLPTGA